MVRMADAFESEDPRLSRLFLTRSKFVVTDATGFDMNRGEVHRTFWVSLAAACCLILAACDKPKPKQDLAQADQATEESQPPPPQRFWGSIDGIDCEKIVG